MQYLDSNSSFSQENPRNITVKNLNVDEDGFFNGEVVAFGSTIYSTRIKGYDSITEPVLSGLTEGSTFGGLIQGANGGHLVAQLLPNDNSDSFCVIGGNTLTGQPNALRFRVQNQGNSYINGVLSVGPSDIASEKIEVNANGIDNAALKCDIEALGTGDPKVVFNVTGGDAYSIGIDNSDGDKLKISNSTNLGTDDVLVCTGQNIEMKGVLSGSFLSSRVSATLTDPDGGIFSENTIQFLRLGTNVIGVLHYNLACGATVGTGITNYTLANPISGVGLFPSILDAFGSGIVVTQSTGVQVGVGTILANSGATTINIAVNYTSDPASSVVRGEFYFSFVVVS